jgi:sulfite reductase alpha subunit-like flavoprotein
MARFRRGSRFNPPESTVHTQAGQSPTIGISNRSMFVEKILTENRQRFAEDSVLMKQIGVESRIDHFPCKDNLGNAD